MCSSIFHIFLALEKIKCSKMLFLSINQVEMIQNANTRIRPMTKAPFLNSKKDSILTETLLLYCYLSSAPDAMFFWGQVQNIGVKPS